MKIALALVAVSVMVWINTLTLTAASTAQISFAPPDANGVIGDSVPIDVMVANVDADPGLASYDLTLKFDPSVVRLDSLSDSGFVPSGQSNIVICVTGTIDNTGGSAAANCTAVPLFGAPGVSTVAPVALLHASFTAIANGVSALTISGSLSGPSGTSIPASFGTGAIHVAAASTPTSTRAATPPPVATTSPVPSVTAVAPTAATSPAPGGATTVQPSPLPSSSAVAPVRVPATGSGRGHAASFRNLTIILLGVLAAVGASALFWARRAGR